MLPSRALATVENYPHTHTHTPHTLLTLYIHTTHTLHTSHHTHYTTIYALLTHLTHSSNHTPYTHSSHTPYTHPTHTTHTHLHAKYYTQFLQQTKLHTLLTYTYNVHIHDTFLTPHTLHTLLTPHILYTPHTTQTPYTIHKPHTSTLIGTYFFSLSKLLYIFFSADEHFSRPIEMIMYVRVCMYVHFFFRGTFNL